MSTKNYILTQKQAIDNFRENDPVANDLFRDLQLQTQEIKETFAKVRAASEHPEIFSALNENMEELNKLNKICKKEYESLMSDKFADFKNRYPTLFDKFINNDMDDNILNHVLDTYTMVEQGQINSRQGRNMGMDFTTQKFGLPKDFFDKNKDFLQ